MSDLIRTVRASILPMPRGSQDAPIRAARDFFASISRISEREQAAQDRNIQQTVRAVRDSSRPVTYTPPQRTLHSGITQVIGTVNVLR